VTPFKLRLSSPQGSPQSPTEQGSGTKALPFLSNEGFLDGVQDMLSQHVHLGKQQKPASLTFTHPPVLKHAMKELPDFVLK
jgi:hypothetical protein